MPLGTRPCTENKEGHPNKSRSQDNCQILYLAGTQTPAGGLFLRRLVPAGLLVPGTTELASEAKSSASPTLRLPVSFSFRYRLASMEAWWDVPWGTFSSSFRQSSLKAESGSVYQSRGHLATMGEPLLKERELWGLSHLDSMRPYSTLIPPLQTMGCSFRSWPRGLPFREPLPQHWVTPKENTSVAVVQGLTADSPIAGLCHGRTRTGRLGSGPRSSQARGWLKVGQSCHSSSGRPRF